MTLSEKLFSGKGTKSHFATRFLDTPHSPWKLLISWVKNKMCKGTREPLSSNRTGNGPEPGLTELRAEGFYYT